MKKAKNFDDNLEEYEVFYVELPSADYLDDIEIQDEYDVPSEKVKDGIDDQGSDFTRASLEAAKEQDRDIDTKDDQTTE